MISWEQTTHSKHAPQVSAWLHRVAECHGFRGYILVKKWLNLEKLGNFHGGKSVFKCFLRVNCLTFCNSVIALHQNDAKIIIHLQCPKRRATDWVTCVQKHLWWHCQLRGQQTTWLADMLTWLPFKASENSHSFCPFETLRLWPWNAVGCIGFDVLLWLRHILAN